jgi:hypothetical protein
MPAPIGGSARSYQPGWRLICHAYRPTDRRLSLNLYARLSNHDNARILHGDEACAANSMSRAERPPICAPPADEPRRHRGRTDRRLGVRWLHR